MFTLALPGGQARVYLQAGRVAQVEGVPELMLGAADGVELSGNMLQDVMAVCQTGVAFDDAYAAAGRGLGRFIALHADSELLCVFEEGVRPPPGCFPMDEPVPRIVSDGFKAHRSADDVARQLAEFMSRDLLVDLTDKQGQSGLGPQILRLQQIARGKSLTQLVTKAVQKGPAALERVWQGLDLLLHLGLVSIDGHNGARRKDERPMPKKEPEPEPEAEAEDDKAVELVELAKSFAAMRPLSALGVEPDAKLGAHMNAQRVEQIFRKVAATYHPDNYPRGRQRVAASRVFAILNQKREDLSDPAVLAEEIERLETLGRGRKWVPANNRKQARVLFQKVQGLEQSKLWPEARKQLKRVLKLDDDTSLYHVMAIWLDVILKEMTPDEAIAAIDSLPLETVADKVEANYRAGRIYRLADRTKKAYQRFQTVLEMVPNHMGAAREVRLIERRASAPKR